MEQYITEVWSGGSMIVSLNDLPHALLRSSNKGIANLYLDLSRTKKWESFCTNFDEGRFRSGCINHADHVLRVIKRSGNDNV